MYYFFTVNEYFFQLQFEISEFIDTIDNYYQLIIVKSGFSSQNYILQILYILLKSLNGSENNSSNENSLRNRIT